MVHLWCHLEFIFLYEVLLKYKEEQLTCFTSSQKKCIPVVEILIWQCLLDHREIIKTFCAGILDYSMGAKEPRNRAVVPAS
jgi:hypothetical protein